MNERKARFASQTFAPLLACVFAFSAEAAFAQAALKYTVMVGKFEDKTPNSNWRDFGGAWSTILTDMLNASGRFIVVSENEMRQEAMAEQAFVASGATVQGRSAPARAQMNPAQILVRGVITDFQSVSGEDRGVSYKGIGIGFQKSTAEVYATLLMVDSSTGTVVASKSVVGKAIDKKTSLKVNRDGVEGGQSIAKNANVRAAIEQAVSQGVTWMGGQLNTIPWRGTVVAVEGEQIFVDRGSREGVSPGMSFVVGESRVIRSPDTGEILDEIVTERARVEVVKVRDRTAICRLTNGEPGTVFEGMGIMPSSL